MRIGGTATVGLLTFDLNGQRCGLLAEGVVEVQRAVTVVRLQGSPKTVEGVIDLRGKLVPVLDVRARLGLPPSPLALTDHFVVARVPRKPGSAASVPRLVAIRVDHARDLLPVLPETIEDPLPVAGPGKVAGVAKLADGLVLIHDLQAFLSLDDELQLDRALLGRP
jgi:purine-binding chemotaxis protein CheW